MNLPRVQINNRQSFVPVAHHRLREAIRAVFAKAGVGNAAVSVGVVDNASLREINKRFLNHDEDTDVISFVLETSPEGLEGEIVVSGEMAWETAPRFAWPPEHELLLYVIHGALHLVGYDDLTEQDAAQMRRAEAETLEQLGIALPREHPPAGATRQGGKPNS